MFLTGSKTVSDLQKRFPALQTELRGLVTQESERVKKEERSVSETNTSSRWRWQGGKLQHPCNFLAEEHENQLTRKNYKFSATKTSLHPKYESARGFNILLLGKWVQDFETEGR